ncbi:MAG: cytidylate kinase family protein, partial [Desulfurococcales archaeon]|nr:cytidylate kinase family protein [Desulfurococcales archaeon]
SGMLFREMAKEKGMTLEEFTLFAEKDHSVDRAIDSRAVAEAMRGCVVLDGHIAAWVAKDHAHLTIYLHASEKVRAERIAQRDGKSLNEALNEVKLRDESEARRYKEIYGINVRDLHPIDLVLNTSKFDADSTYEICMEAVKQVLKGLTRLGKA